MATSGFMAIQPPRIPQGPVAKRQIVRGPDGTPQVVLIDLATGQPVTDPTGYGILESGSYFDESTLQAQQPSTNKNDTKQQGSIAQEVIRSTGEGGSRGTGSEPGSGNFGRHQGSNFGYANKPGALGLAGALPGMLGLVGKAVNAGINANNVAAVNAARQSMGLEPVGIGGAIKGTLKDNKGQIGDFDLGTGMATPVGLEALSPDGMTNMTPQEAARRAAANQAQITQATPEAIQARDDAFRAEFAKPGLMDRISGVATSFLDSMFGGVKSSAYKPDPVAHAQITNQNTGSNFNPSKSGFADMIGATAKGGPGGFSPSDTAFGDMMGTNEDKGSNMAGSVGSYSGAMGGQGQSGLGGGGLSPGASAAIGRGEGGLY